jgi:hypothetical protein
MNFDTIQNIGYEVRQSVNHTMGRTPHTVKAANVAAHSHYFADSPYLYGYSAPPVSLRRITFLDPPKQPKSQITQRQLPRLTVVVLSSHHNAELVELRLVTGL